MYNFIIYALYEQVKVRKPAKRCLFLMPNLRTTEKQRKQINKTAKMRFCLFWQGQLCNLRNDFMRDLLAFGKDVNAFLQIL